MMQTSHQIPRAPDAAILNALSQEGDMFDAAAFDAYLLPEAEEIMEIAPYEDDVMMDLPEFNTAIREAVDRRMLDDALPTTYGA